MLTILLKKSSELSIKKSAEFLIQHWELTQIDSILI